MNWSKILNIIIAVALVAAVTVFYAQHKAIESLRQDRDRYQHNTEVLLSDVELYRVQDSLSAARVENLELTIKEFQRFRAEDAALIRSLQNKNRDLASINKTQSETIIALQSIPRDTVIITKDSVVVPAIKIHCGDDWYDFNGLLTKDLFTGTLQNRDSLVVAETVRYKRFLGFLWKTKEVKDRQVDVVSKNPHTQLVGVEYVTIQK